MGVLKERLVLIRLGETVDEHVQFAEVLLNFTDLQELVQELVFVLFLGWDSALSLVLSLASIFCSRHFLVLEVL